MLRKIALLSFLCIMATQSNFAKADWTSEKFLTNAPYIGAKVLAVTAGSCILHHLLTLAVNKLEKDKRISPRTAQTLKVYIGLKSLIIPALVITDIYIHDKQFNNTHALTNDFNLVFNMFKHALNNSTGIFSAEYELWQYIKPAIIELLWPTK